MISGQELIPVVEPVLVLITTAVSEIIGHTAQEHPLRPQEAAPALRGEACPEPPASGRPLLPRPARGITILLDCCYR